MNNQKEIWKRIHCENGYYLISSLGNVKRPESKFIRKNGSSIRIPERIIKVHIDKSTGYKRFNFNNNNKSKKIYLHRAIAMAFIENPKNKNYINHLNGIKTDNRIENLEWVTASENMQHAYDTKLKGSGNKHYNAKLKIEQVISIKEMANSGDYKQKEIAFIYGIDQSVVSRIKNNKSWIQSAY